jgi:hypothetical protein
MEYIHIYNMTQADFYIKSGIQVKGAGTGSKGQSYILFINDEHTKEVYRQWKTFKTYIDKNYK